MRPETELLRLAEAAVTCFNTKDKDKTAAALDVLGGRALVLYGMGQAGLDIFLLAHMVRDGVRKGQWKPHRSALQALVNRLRTAEAAASAG